PIADSFAATVNQGDHSSRRARGARLSPAGGANYNVTGARGGFAALARVREQGRGGRAAMTRTAVLCTTLALFAAAPAAAQAPEPAAGADEHWGVLQTYCYACHNFEDWAG